MAHSIGAIDRQAKTSDGKPSQSALALLGEVSSYQMLPASVVAAASFNGCLVEAARHSGMDDQEIAAAIHICGGYMSRFMRGVAQQWARRMVAYMRVTRSLAPLQWMCDQLGCDVVPRSSYEARVRELEDELQTLKTRRKA